MTIVPVTQPQHNPHYGVGNTEQITTNLSRWKETLGAWLLSYSADHTRAAYKRDSLDYLAWLDEVSLDVASVERRHADVYKLLLEQQGCTGSTVARKLSALTAFYAYAELDNPFKRVRRPRVANESSTAGLTASEARQLIETARINGARDGGRSHAFITLLLHTGVRASEALNARTTDLGWDQGYRTLTVTRKGGKRQKIVVPAPAQHALDEYHGAPLGKEVASAAQPGSGSPLFVTETGKQWARSEAYRTIRRLARRAGVRAEISPHSLRHAYATLALSNGVALHDVQDALGHASADTTQRYNRARRSLDKSPSNRIASILAES